MEGGEAPGWLGVGAGVGPPGMPVNTGGGDVPGGAGVGGVPVRDGGAGWSGAPPLPASTGWGALAPPAASTPAPPPGPSLPLPSDDELLQAPATSSEHAMTGRVSARIATVTARDTLSRFALARP